MSNPFIQHYENLAVIEQLTAARWALKAREARDVGDLIGAQVYQRHAAIHAWHAREDFDTLIMHKREQEA